MSFYPVPPTIQAEVYLRIPDDLRCGPVADTKGNFYAVDVPYGRVLKIHGIKEVTVVGEWDCEPNGLAVLHDGTFVVADYKQGMLSLDPTAGTVKPLFTRRHLERLRGPNDLIVDSKGNVYFTDQGQMGIPDG
ncbi:hypothetical protein F4808DRAFT_458188 [Astrocystis sublimbata]|nr:hypothetical protein F4808DRAFT_458188 [Astrocystis sublimbata]